MYLLKNNCFFKFIFFLVLTKNNSLPTVQNSMLNKVIAFMIMITLQRNNINTYIFN